MCEEIEFDLKDKVKLSEEYFNFFSLGKNPMQKIYGIGKIIKIISGGDDGVVEIEWSSGAVTSISCSWLDKIEKSLSCRCQFEDEFYPNIKKENV